MPNPDTQSNEDKLTKDKFMSKTSDYSKYKLYRGGEYVGYVAIYKRDHNFIRALFERCHAVITPFMSHYISTYEPQPDGSTLERPDGDYLAHFNIVAAEEDVKLMMEQPNA